MKILYKNLLYILLGTFLIVSCNDDSNLDYNNEKTPDCSEEVKKECITGKWKISSAFINNKEQILTSNQKKQYIEFTDDNTVSTNIYLMNKNNLKLSNKDNFVVSKLNFSLIDDGGKYKKIRFQASQIKIEYLIQSVNNNDLILLNSGKIENSQEDFNLKTVWTKV